MYDTTAPTGTVSASAYVTKENTVTVYVDNPADNLSGISTVQIKGFYGDSWVSAVKSLDATYDSANNRYYATFTFSEIPNTSTGDTNQGDGLYKFDAHLYDGAGNWGMTSNQIGVRLDTVAPQISIVETEEVVQDGLIRHYDGLNNTGSGHSSSPTTWKDLTGNYDATFTGEYAFGEDYYYGSFDSEVEMNNAFDGGVIEGQTQGTFETKIYVGEEGSSYTLKTPAGRINFYNDREWCP